MATAAKGHIDDDKEPPVLILDMDFKRGGQTHRETIVFDKFKPDILYRFNKNFKSEDKARTTLLEMSLEDYFVKIWELDGMNSGNLKAVMMALSGHADSILGRGGDDFFFLPKLCTIEFRNAIFNPEKKDLAPTVIVASLHSDFYKLHGEMIAGKEETEKKWGFSI